MSGGSLLSIRSSESSSDLDAETVSFLLKEILQSLNELHAQGIVHRNIKLSNILLDSNHGVRLADFGVSGLLHGWTMKNVLRISNTSVAPYWIAPELNKFSIGLGYSFKADIYAFGCTALEMTRGPLLPSHAPPTEFELSKWFRFLEPDYKAVNIELGENFTNMIKLCLHPNPANRPTCETLLTDAYFQGPEVPPLLSFSGLAVGLTSLDYKHLKMKSKYRKMPMECIKREAKKRKVMDWNFIENDWKFEPILPGESDSKKTEAGPSALVEEGGVIEKVEGVFKLVMLGRFKDKISDQEEEKLITDYSDLLNEMECVMSFEWGKDLNIEDGQEGYTHIFEVTFETREAMSEFSTHPVQNPVADSFSLALEKFAVINCKPIVRN